MQPPNLGRLHFQKRSADPADLLPPGHPHFHDTALAAPRKGWAKAAGLVLSVAVVALAAGVGSRFMPDAWYRNLAKPSFNPPDWIFGPVWTLLYLLMAVAAWLVWLRAGLRGGKVALALFTAQLALNGAWTPLFFGLHEIGWALADLAVLWLAIAATLISFWRIRPLAGVLLAPYLAWVSFAAR